MDQDQSQEAKGGVISKLEAPKKNINKSGFQSQKVKYKWIQSGKVR